jgi:hypothetical protein
VGGTVGYSMVTKTPYQTGRSPTEVEHMQLLRFFLLAQTIEIYIELLPFWLKVLILVCH